MSSIIEQYLNGPQKDPTPRGEASQVSTDHCGSQTLDRPVLMLDLVLEDQTRIAFAYATLARVLMEPERGMVLSFATDEVLIEGTALDALYKAIIQHRASRIEVTDTSRNLAAASEEVGAGRVTAIRIMDSDRSQ